MLKKCFYLNENTFYIDIKIFIWVKFYNILYYFIIFKSDFIMFMSW